jgi:hypothetical protein
MGEREAFEAAERLVREAQARAEQAGREVPSNGWATGGPPPTEAFPDLAALLKLVDGLRGQLPPELARQLTDALRQLLVALRAVLDYSIAKLDQPPAGEREVEDIPIT